MSKPYYSVFCSESFLPFFIYSILLESVTLMFLATLRFSKPVPNPMSTVSSLLDSLENATSRHEHRIGHVSCHFVLVFLIPWNPSLLFTSIALVSVSYDFVLVFFEGSNCILLVIMLVLLHEILIHTAVFISHLV